MDLVEAASDDVEVLADYWFSLASGMEQYSELNELAVENPMEARSGFERQLDRDDTTVFLLEDEERVSATSPCEKIRDRHESGPSTRTSSTCSSNPSTGTAATGATR